MGGGIGTGPFPRDDEKRESPREKRDRRIGQLLQNHHTQNMQAAYGNKEAWLKNFLKKRDREISKALGIPVKKFPKITISKSDVEMLLGFSLDD